MSQRIFKVSGEWCSRLPDKFRDCAYCDEKFQGGDKVVLYPVGPAEGEEVLYFKGKPCLTVAIPLHYHCAVQIEEKEK